MVGLGLGSTLFLCEGWVLDGARVEYLRGRIN